MVHEKIRYFFVIILDIYNRIREGIPKLHKLVKE